MNYMIDVLHDLSRMSGWPAREGGAFNADPLAVPPGPGKETYDSDLSEGAFAPSAIFLALPSPPTS
jgi:uncharacterized protein